MKIFLATANPHKVGELAAILRARCGEAVAVLPPAALGGMPEVDESADTFAGNARLKAHALAARLPRGDAGNRGSLAETDYVVADDSGLCVDLLGGAPGVRSARFAGVGAGDIANTQKLLGLLREVPAEKRTAAFHCTIALVNAAGESWIFEGRCPGRIIDAPRGPGGFGYDPVFVPDGYELTFAELDARVKNRISHRARALRELAEWLEKVPKSKV